MDYQRTTKEGFDAEFQWEQVRAAWEDVQEELGEPVDDEAWEEYVAERRHIGPEDWEEDDGGESHEQMLAGTARTEAVLGTEQMTAIVEKVNEIESINGELAATAESAWWPGFEPISDHDRAAVLRALREMRAERNRLEDELDALLEGLGR